MLPANQDERMRRSPRLMYRSWGCESLGYNGDGRFCRKEDSVSPYNDNRDKLKVKGHMWKIYVVFFDSLHSQLE